MRLKVVTILFVLIGLVFAQKSDAVTRASYTKQVAEPVVVTLQAHKQYPLMDKLTYRYSFAKRPKLGTSILKIVITNPEGKVATQNFTVKGSADMPAMQGAHASGESIFKLNKRGEFLLPVDAVMRGDWAVTVIILQGKKEIKRAKVVFKV